MTRSVLLAMALLSPFAADGDPDIKGVRLGMTNAEVMAAHPGLKCHGSYCYYSSTLASSNVESLRTLAGSRVSTWWFTFPDKSDKLVMTYVVLAASSGPMVTSALTEKFGNPESVQTSEFKTAAGLSGPKTTTRWIDGDSIISVEYPSGKINEMRVEMVSKAYRDAQVEAFKAKAKKDL